jgi:hypothetical protein
MVTRYKLEVCNRTGVITVWMQSEHTPCGFVPIIAWTDMTGVREFAEMLLDFYNHRRKDIEKVKKTSDYIIQQAIGEHYINDGGNNEQEDDL